MKSTYTNIYKRLSFFVILSLYIPFSYTVKGQCSKSTFTPISQFPVGYGAKYAFQDFITHNADMDGDSLSDLIFDGRNTSNGKTCLLVRRNNSAGKLPSQISFDTTIEVYSHKGSLSFDFVINDFNNDAKPDIVLTFGNYPGLDSLQILINKSAKDSIVFYALPPIALKGAEMYPTLKTNDFDKDGKQDIMYEDTSKQLFIILNRIDTSKKSISFDSTIGTGIFCDSFHLSTYGFKYLVNNNYTSFAIGDLNNDTLPDIVFTKYNTDSIYIYKNNSSSGKIDFSLAEIDTVPDKMITSLFWDGNYVQIRDIDNNGKQDIAILYDSSGSFSVQKLTFLKNGSIGKSINMIFTSTINLTHFTNVNKYVLDTFGDTLSNVSFSDFAFVNNGGTNKLPDILLTIEGAFQRNRSIGYLANNSNVSSISYTAPCWFTQAPADRVDVGDFNNDGKDDLISWCDVCMPSTPDFGFGIFINQSTSTKADEAAVNSISKLRIIPNPTVDEAHILSPDKILNVQVITMTGDIVKQVNVPGLNNTDISFNGLSAGLYYQRIITEKGVVVEKVVRVL